MKLLPTPEIETERRGARRVPYRARVVTAGPLGGEARTTNISVGGLYLQCFEGAPLRQGDLLELVIDLPGGAISARGRVVGEGAEVFFGGAAIQFVRMSALDRVRLESFVRSRRCAPPRGAILGRVPVERRAA